MRTFLASMILEKDYLGRLEALFGQLKQERRRGMG